MNIKNIEKWSLCYAFLKTWANTCHNYIFYKKIVVSNIENIPHNGHLIFTTNHQNAFMDAMALISAIKSQTVFLARSDIFGKPFVARLLILFKILPIYRIRDGFDSLKKNDEVFLKTIDVIKNKNGLVILPEGNHEGFRRLRPLKKGFARIALQTEEANDYSLDIKIIPIGLDYSTYEDCRTTLHINFGKPLAVSEFYELYKTTPVKGINQLTTTLSEHLKPLMVNIESEEYYTLYNKLREIYKYRMCKRMSFPHCDQPYKLKSDQELIRILRIYEEDHQGEMSELQNQIIKYLGQLKSFGISNDLIENGGRPFISLLGESVFLLLTSPVFLYGLVNNLIPYLLIIKIVKKIKDIQFHSSFKFVISLFLFPAIYVLQSVVVKIIFSFWWITGIYLISLPLTGGFAYFWNSKLQNLKSFCKYYSQKRKKISQIHQIIGMHEIIIKTTDKIVREYS